MSVSLGAPVWVLKASEMFVFILFVCVCAHMLSVGKVIIRSLEMKGDKVRRCSV